MNCSTLTISSRIKYILLLSSFLHFALFSESSATNQKVTLILECVKDLGNGSYEASFGYDNPHDYTITVNKRKSYILYNKGRKKQYVNNVFNPGSHENVFTFTFSENDKIYWKVIFGWWNLSYVTVDKHADQCVDNSNIRALFDAEVEGGVLWPELAWLADQETFESNEIFQIDNTNAGDETVLVEVVAFENTDLSSLRQSLVNNYGFTNEIPNGDNPLVLSGFLPISNLNLFNEEPLSSLVNFVRPIVTANLNGEWTFSGLVGTQQDLAMGTDLTREGFGIDGTGTIICVVSDSYGNPTAGIGSGDLPPASKMEVLADLSSVGPFTGTREGAAMVELIYDIAPGADFKFWTGTASPGYMAYGITQFVEEGCDIAVDDVTHLFEPFLPIGQIAQAVEFAENSGVHYVSSTGNYANRGFQGNFTNMTIPANFGDFSGTVENAHNFGSGLMKEVSLTAGVYIIVLQWDDEFWAQGQTPGAQHDLNFWVVDENGNFQYFGNRDNNGDEFDPTGEDPIEILGFEVLNPTTLNVMITGENIPEGLPFQYIVFKAPENGWQFTDPAIEFNATTIVGHAASPSVTSVGAAFYGYTPEFENRSDMMEPFSSEGGTNLLGNQLLKPDITAPDGGNTSFFGQVVSYDGDDFPNFFGTSASAPAAAASMALTLELFDKLYDVSEGPIKAELSPTALRSLLQTTASDIEDPGFDTRSGAGLIQLNQTALSVANPTPQILDIIIENGTPGIEPVKLTLVLQYPVVDEDGTPIIGEGGTEIKLREEVLPFTNDNWEWAVNGQDEYIINYFVDIGPIIGNPAITVSNPPKAAVDEPVDGGSVTLNILDIPKKDLLVKAGNANKLFGESIPVEDFTYTIYEVDPTNPDPAAWQEFILPPLEKALLDDAISYSAEFTDLDGDVQPVDFLTEVGPYPIKLLLPAGVPQELTEIYNFIGFSDDNRGFGALFIDPLPVTVTPDNQTIEYGSKLDITLTYNFMTPDIPDSSAVAQYIIQSHQELLTPDYFAIANKGLALVDKGLALVDKGLALVDKGLALVDGSSWMITQDALQNKGLALVDGANNVYDIGIDVSAQFILEDPTVSFLENKGLALVDGQTLFEAGAAGVPFIENKGLALVDKGLALVDKGLALVDDDGNPVEKDFKLFFIVSEDDEEVNEIKSVHFVSGLDVLPPGFNHVIASGALLNQNLVVTGELAELHILPKPISIAIDDTNPTNLGKVYGEEDPTFIYEIIDGTLIPGDELSGDLMRAEGELVGSYPFNLGSVKAGNPNDPPGHEYYGLNYTITLADDPIFEISKANLTVTANNQAKVYGDPEVFVEPSISYSGWIGGDGITDLDTPPTLSTTVNQNTDVGIYAASILVEGGMDDNYAFNYVNGDFTVTKAILTATANNQNKVYGDPVYFVEPSILYTGWKGSDGIGDLDTPPVVSASIDQNTGVGIYTASILVEGGMDENYEFNFIAGDYTVTTALLTATANNQTKVYGDPVVFAEPSITYSGWKGSDDTDVLDTPPMVSTTVDESTYAGIYQEAITISGGADDNYEFNIVAGDFTVLQATLIATASNQTKIYGDPVVLDEPSISYSGWKGSDGVDDLDTPPMVSTTVDESTFAGIYQEAITINGGADDNYEFNFVAGDFTVLQATLVAAASNQTKIYGDPVVFTEPGISYTGWKGTDGVSDLDTPPSVSTTIDQTTIVGNYTDVISVSDGLDDNYVFSYEPGDFTVSQATLVATASNQTKVYGDPVVFVEPSISYSGWKGTDDVGDLDVVPTVSTIVNEMTNVGVYPETIAVDGGSDANYAFSYEAGDFTVTQAAVTVVADNLSKVYGNDDPDLTYTITSGQLYNGDILSGELNRTVGEIVSSYPINQGTLADEGNYDLTFIPGVFTISKAQLIVTADDKTITINKYNDEDDEGEENYEHLFPEWTSTVTGLVNGDTENDVFTTEAKYSIRNKWFVPFELRIIPHPRKLAEPNNYHVTFVEGTLYIEIVHHSEDNARKTAPDLDERESLEEELSISSYPNPTSDMLYINMDVDRLKSKELSLVDIQGRIFDVNLTKNPARNRLEIDISRLTSGVYFINLDLENESKILKIIKQ